MGCAKLQYEIAYIYVLLHERTAYSCAYTTYLPGVADTVRFDHIKRHYYDRILDIDPEIVAAGPSLQFTDARYAPGRRRALVGVG